VISSGQQAETDVSKESSLVCEVNSSRSSCETLVGYGGVGFYLTLFCNWLVKVASKGPLRLTGQQMIHCERLLAICIACEDSIPFNFC
jgi:hypothetical protein